MRLPNEGLDDYLETSNIRILLSMYVYIYICILYFSCWPRLV